MPVSVPPASQGFCEPHRNPTSPRHGGRPPQESHGRNGALRYTAPEAVGLPSRYLRRVGPGDAWSASGRHSTGETARPGVGMSITSVNGVSSVLLVHVRTP